MSTIFRAWARHSDAYLSARPIAHTIKVSFHEHGGWRMALTREHVERGSPFLMPGADRASQVWKRPPEIEPGWTSALLIIVPATQLGRAPDRDISRVPVVWHRDPGEGIETRYWVLFAAPSVRPEGGWPGRYSMGTEQVGRLDLANGETVWIVCHDAPSTLESFLTNQKPLMSADAPHARLAYGQPGTVLRGYMFGTLENGTRVWLDLNFDDPSLWTQNSERAGD